jgi:hypothetical protein
MDPSVKEGAMRRMHLGFVASLLALGLASGAPAAVPVPPDQVAWSGVLVDGLGAPLAGPVDLIARLYDAASGGVLVFKQSFSGVTLSDGHYTVLLGPTGSATDSPTDPLTTSLRTALTGDLAAGAGRFVEITVDADPPLARVQLVLVPYAMQADHAATSDVSTQSLDTQAVDGLDGGVLTELFEHYNEDGGPPGGDPSEGTADVDGDGEMNFVDPDNDNDGRSDSVEVSGGTNINLVTPFASTLNPTTGTDSAVTPVTVTGTGFLPGLTATLGSQSFNPSPVTSTGFLLQVGPQTAGVKNLVVTNTNGETTTKLNAFQFVGPTPPPNPVPLPGGLVYGAPTQIVLRGDNILVTGLVASGANRSRYAADTIVDSTIAFDLSTALTGALVPAHASWNSNRVIHGLRGWALTDQIQLLRDGNADNLLSSSEAIAIESPGVDPRPQSPSLLFDASDRVAGGYLRNVGGLVNAVAFHDRNGDGFLTGPNEVVTIEPLGSATDHLGEAAFDPSGRLAYAYYNPTSGVLRLAWDRNGDGDFADTISGNAEVNTVASTTTPFCFGMAFDTAGRPGVIYGTGTTPQLRRDLNGDGDFVDAGESPSLPTTGVSSYGCDVTAASSGDRLVIVHNGGTLRVLCDLNDDGDYADLDENVTVASSSGPPLAATKTASGELRVLGPTGVFLGPVR